MLALEENDESAFRCIADTFEKTCALEDPWGCTMYGFILMKGVGRRLDYEASFKYFDKACRYSEARDPACTRAKELKTVARKTKKNMGAAK